MSPTDFPHRRFLSLLLATLCAGPVACDPAVSRFDMDSAQARLDAQTTRLAALEEQVKTATKDLKELQAYGGPEHQSKMRMADALRGEKAELETLKKDLDTRLAYFDKETARHIDALVKMKQQVPSTPVAPQPDTKPSPQ